MEKNGVIETRTERRTVITRDADNIDHDKVTTFHISHISHIYTIFTSLQLYYYFCIIHVLLLLISM